MVGTAASFECQPEVLSRHQKVAGEVQTKQPEPLRKERVFNAIANRTRLLFCAQNVAVEQGCQRLFDQGEEHAHH